MSDQVQRRRIAKLRLAIKDLKRDVKRLSGEVRCLSELVRSVRRPAYPPSPYQPHRRLQA